METRCNKKCELCDNSCFNYEDYKHEHRCKNHMRNLQAIPETMSNISSSASNAKITKLNLESDNNLNRYSIENSDSGSKIKPNLISFRTFRYLESEQAISEEPESENKIRSFKLESEQPVTEKQDLQNNITNSGGKYHYGKFMKNKDVKKNMLDSIVDVENSVFCGCLNKRKNLIKYEEYIEENNEESHNNTIKEEEEIYEYSRLFNDNEKEINIKDDNDEKNDSRVILTTSRHDRKMDDECDKKENSKETIKLKNKSKTKEKNSCI